MNPERESPYWKAIVRDNWPEISPRTWGRLEALAREGAEALDPAEADRMRRAFDDRVRSSASLQPIKDELLAQQGTLRGFVDALVAAADTFGQMSSLVDRTRDRILNAVDGALRKISAARAAAAAAREKEEEAGGDGSEADARLRRDIRRILAEARAEVDDIAAAALREVGPQGLPELAAIAAALGQPGPWRGGPEGSDGPGGGPRYRSPRAGSDGPGGPGTHGVRSLPQGLRPSGGPFVPHLPSLQDLRDLLRPNESQLPLSRLPGWDIIAPDEVEPGIGHAPAPEDGTSAGPAVQVPPGSGPAPQAAPTGGGRSLGPMANPQADGGPPAAEVVAPEHRTVDAAPDQSDTVAAQHVSHTEIDSDDSRAGTADSGAERRTGESGAPDLTAGPGRRTDDTTGSENPPSWGVAAGMAAQMPMFAAQQPTFTPDRPPVVNSPAAAGAGADPRATSAPDSRNAIAAPRVTSAPGGSPGAVPGVSAPGVTAPPAAGPAKSQPPGRHTGEAGAGADKATGSEKSPDKDDTTGSGDLVRDAVGAAMAAAAAPTFMLGKRVDGDLVLARSLLASLLAAAGAPAVGTEWAVSIMRHDGGVSAFVTSNDGRGWLPPGVFLPRELSTPWVWSVAEGPAWEGLADPARVLAEFALSWGRRTGARLSALVSSAPFDELLARQLGEVALEGSVEPGPTMDFSTPAPGLADRLELVTAPPVLERVAAIPADRIGSRGLDFAYDAHQRLAVSGPDPFASLGAAELRHRIMQTILQGGPVQAQWWEQLFDADQLLAASMLPLLADVSRVPLGELRSEHSTGRSATDSATLRLSVAQRRCNEMVLLMSGEPSRQRLRDIVYAHGQVAEYLAAVPAGTITPEPVRRPTITAPPPR
ncbi:hypothetical protein B7C42_06785 [Nocardia cerradoensis]|uniref:Uncharacterized protein n=1 Tax=Nocardia cerradoensis TaxID=85688 RepID=A0A231GX63_9NOCA|nr:hypothetical protein [Nocardia cerradoensis]OXR41189.1 hypothetical protein B7C42_06785 [Nocardia cerradoensis]